VQLLLDAIAEGNEVQVTDGELTEYLVRQAARYNMAPKEFADQIVQAGNLPMLMADVRRNKALSELLESATITDASGNAVDLSALAPGALAEIAEGDMDDMDDADDIDDTDDAGEADGEDGSAE
jgi:trigger factor